LLGQHAELQVEMCPLLAAGDLVLLVYQNESGEKNGVFSTIAGKSAMTQTSKCRKILAKNTWPRRALPCLVPDSIFLTPRKALPVQKSYQKQRSFDAVATMHTSLVRVVADRVFETGPVPGCCMTWAIWFTVGPAPSNSFTRSISAPSAASTSTRIP